MAGRALNVSRTGGIHRPVEAVDDGLDVIAVELGSVPIDVADFAVVAVVVPAEPSVADVGVGGRLGDFVRGGHGHGIEGGQSRRLNVAIVTARIGDDRVANVG